MRSPCDADSFHARLPTLSSRSKYGSLHRVEVGDDVGAVRSFLKPEGHVRALDVLSGPSGSRTSSGSTTRSPTRCSPSVLEAGDLPRLAADHAEEVGALLVRAALVRRGGTVAHFALKSLAPLAALPSSGPAGIVFVCGRVVGTVSELVTCRECTSCASWEESCILVHVVRAAVRSDAFLSRQPFERVVWCRLAARCCRCCQLRVVEGLRRMASSLRSSPRLCSSLSSHRDRAKLWRLLAWSLRRAISSMSTTNGPPKLVSRPSMGARMAGVSRSRSTSGVAARVSSASS